MWTNSQNQKPDGKLPFDIMLNATVSKVVEAGYKECFKLTGRGLYSTSTSRYYRPEQVQIFNLYRFSCQPKPCDDSVLYVIETSDGLKGTLMNSGVNENKFMSEVEDISRKIARHNRHDC